jgi:hypothetical protein
MVSTDILSVKYVVRLIIVAVDFEFYSSNGRGAFQGQGYIYRNLNK